MLPVLGLLIAFAGTAADNEDFVAGQAYYAEFEFDKAALRFNEALHDESLDDAGKAQVYVHLGLAYAMLNEVGKARAAFESAVKLDREVALPPDTPPKLKKLFASVLDAQPAAPPEVPVDPASDPATEKVGDEPKAPAPVDVGVRVQPKPKVRAKPRVKAEKRVDYRFWTALAAGGGAALGTCVCGGGAMVGLVLCSSAVGVCGVPVMGASSAAGTLAAVFGYALFADYWPSFWAITASVIAAGLTGTVGGVGVWLTAFGAETALPNLGGGERLLAIATAIGVTAIVSSVAGLSAGAMVRLMDKPAEEPAKAKKKPAAAGRRDTNRRRESPAVAMLY
jgi:hypothetical protein